DLQDDGDTITGVFVVSEGLGYALEFAGRFVSSSGGIVMSAGEHEYARSEKENRLKWKDLKGPAKKFSLEMQVNNRDALEYSEDEQVKLHPTNETYAQIERWKAIHQLEPNFP